MEYTLFKEVRAEQVHEPIHLLSFKMEEINRNPCYFSFGDIYGPELVLTKDLAYEIITTIKHNSTMGGHSTYSEDKTYDWPEFLMTLCSDFKDTAVDWFISINNPVDESSDWLESFNKLSDCMVCLPLFWSDFECELRKQHQIDLVFNDKWDDQWEAIQFGNWEQTCVFRYVFAVAYNDEWFDSDWMNIPHPIELETIKNDLSYMANRMLYHYLAYKNDGWADPISRIVILSEEFGPCPEENIRLYIRILDEFIFRKTGTRILEEG